MTLLFLNKLVSIHDAWTFLSDLVSLLSRSDMKVKES